MSVKLIEFCAMTEGDMFRLVHGIYAEANFENAQWRRPGLADYTEAVKEEEGIFLNFLRSFMQKPQNRYYVLESDGQWVSALRLTRIDDFYYLEALETAPEHRKRGFAARLIHEVIRLLRQRGRVILRSNVSKKNIPSLATHRKCGFEIAEENGVNCLTGKRNEFVYGMRYADMEQSSVKII